MSCLSDKSCVQIRIVADSYKAKGVTIYETTMIIIIIRVEKGQSDSKHRLICH